MVTLRVTIVNPLGLHARAAARFVGTASRFKSHIQVTRGDRTIDGKSILGLLMLGAALGTAIDISADGSDEHDATLALSELTARGFEES